MKILILSPFFPYNSVPHAGGKFTCEIIKELSSSHEITLLSRVEPKQLNHVEEMNPFCKKIILYPFKTPESNSIFTILKIIFSYLFLGIRANRLIRTANFDLIHVEHTQTAMFLSIPKRLPATLLAHDVVTKPAMRRYSGSKSLFNSIVNRLILEGTRFAEKLIAKKFNRVFALSEIDRNLLLDISPGISSDVVPYPINIPYKKRLTDNDELQILFCGAMNRQVNIDAVCYFAEKVFPSVLKKIPDALFFIVGNNPGKAVKKLEEYNKSIIVTGFVDDLSPFYQKASIFVSPLFTGGGIIVKNLQAMSYAVPVVTTSIGNEGIKAAPNEEILIADTPDEFLKSVILLLQDNTYNRLVGKKGKDFVTRNFEHNSVVTKLKNHFRQLSKQKC